MTKIKTQEVRNEAVTVGKDDDNNQPKASPLMFPFGHHSPSMFPSNIGPMHSPMFSSNLQSAQMFNAPLSGTNGSSSIFLPATNPNGQHSHSHSHFHSMSSSFGHTASTLPMPLQLPMTGSSGTTKGNAA